jgi:hypothetical protein
MVPTPLLFNKCISVIEKIDTKYKICSSVLAINKDNLSNFARTHEKIKFVKEKFVTGSLPYVGLHTGDEQIKFVIKKLLVRKGPKSGEYISTSYINLKILKQIV